MLNATGPSSSSPHRNTHPTWSLAASGIVMGLAGGAAGFAFIGIGAVIDTIGLRAGLSIGFLATLPAALIAYRALAGRETCEPRVLIGDVRLPLVQLRHRPGSHRAARAAPATRPDHRITTSPSPAPAHRPTTHRTPIRRKTTMASQTPTMANATQRRDGLRHRASPGPLRRAARPAMGCPRACPHPVPTVADPARALPRRDDAARHRPTRSREVLGQAQRIVVAGPASAVGRYPAGNTGRARVPATSRCRSPTTSRNSSTVRRDVSSTAGPSIRRPRISSSTLGRSHRAVRDIPSPVR